MDINGHLLSDNVVFIDVVRLTVTVIINSKGQEKVEGLRRHLP